MNNLIQLSSGIFERKCKRCASLEMSQSTQRFPIKTKWRTICGLFYVWNSISINRTRSTTTATYLQKGHYTL